VKETESAQLMVLASQMEYQAKVPAENMVQTIKL
jgi:hypothetical protein